MAPAFRPKNVVCKDERFSAARCLHSQPESVNRDPELIVMQHKHAHVPSSVVLLLHGDSQSLGGGLIRSKWTVVFVDGVGFFSP